jgi:hypothetical protein
VTGVHPRPSNDELWRRIKRLEKQLASPGGGGVVVPGSGDFRTVTIGTPQSTWVVPHSLPFDPAVTTQDSTGTTVHGRVTYAPGVVTIQFASTMSGKVTLS